MTERDDLAAEREYLSQRAAELAETIKRDLKAYAECADVAATAESISPALLEQMQSEIVAVLTSAGHEQLARDWLAAWRAWDAKDSIVDRWVAEHAGSGEPLSDADVHQLSDLRAAAADALEQFERVAAQVESVLEKRGAQ